MDSTAPTEAREEMDAAAEPPPHVRMKELQLPQQPPESHAASENHAGAGDQPPEASARSPDTFLEVLAAAESESMAAEQQQGDPHVMVEELTLKSYRLPSLYMDGGGAAAGAGVGGVNGGDSSARRGMWQNFSRMGGAAAAQDALPKESDAIGSRQHLRSSFLHQFGAQRAPPPPQAAAAAAAAQRHAQLEQNHPDSHGAVRTKVLNASGFPQFMVRNSLKGKGVAYRSPPALSSPGVVIRNQEKESKPLIGGGAGGSCALRDPAAGLDPRHDGISMREWLTQTRSKKSNEEERMHIFKQIVELVNVSHSRGLVLQHLRPSHFTILPVNQVRYIGSLCPKGQLRESSGAVNWDTGYVDHHLERKRHMEQDMEGSRTPKQQRFGMFGARHNMFAARADLKGDMNSLRATVGVNPKSEYRKQLQMGKAYYSSVSQNPDAYRFDHQMSKSEFVKLEEKWYFSPEELKEGVYSFSSNIYNLGVLLFELFCYFGTSEVHSAAMSDLYHRILPPNFLSESPKVASFCLWLLHPEPSSRPKSRDILSCGLICEGKKTSSLDRSSASIDEEDAEADLLLYFLLNSQEEKEKQASKLVADLGYLQKDIQKVKKRQFSRGKVLPNSRDLIPNFNDISEIRPYKEMVTEDPVRLPLSEKNNNKLIKNIDQLQNVYFSMRSKIELSDAKTVARSDKEVLKIRDRSAQVQSNSDVRKDSSDRVGGFFDGLCKYARYSRFEVCATLRNADILNSTNVICSLSFDRDEEYFAAAGVSKKIKIFQFSALLNDSVDIHYPLIELPSRSKLSWVCWNNYIKNYLASTDYDGVVQLWDAGTGQGLTQYTEHQKRAWSVDFSQVDPMKLASGSDDCSVKLWSINEKKCIDTIRSKANVCCVQFSSYSSHLLAFGSADYKTYCYDLRYTRIPWCTLSGHGKSVSYVKFVDSETVISASTDNTLKLWDLNKSDSAGLSMDACTLTFSGHTNEKNFVGLSVSDGYITCGSETNEVYAYYKTLPMPITSHKFGSIDPVTGQEAGDDNSQFVSSVCWRGRSGMVVAANSSGSIKLLQMV